MSNSDNVNKLGKAAESAAAAYLTRQGLALKTQNYHCRWGEIDLIMDDDQTLVFVEVRYRKNNSFGHALETIDQKKQKKIIKAALHYTQKNHLFDNTDMRFDVVSLTSTDKQLGDNNVTIDWVKNAFYA